jgi:hypothetical protein
LIKVYNTINIFKAGYEKITPKFNKIISEFCDIGEELNKIGSNFLSVAKEGWSEVAPKLNAIKVECKNIGIGTFNYLKNEFTKSNINISKDAIKQPLYDIFKKRFEKSIEGAHNTYDKLNSQKEELNKLENIDLEKRKITLEATLKQSRQTEQECSEIDKSQKAKRIECVKALNKLPSIDSLEKAIKNLSTDHYSKINDAKKAINHFELEYAKACAAIKQDCLDVKYNRLLA